MRLIQTAPPQASQTGTTTAGSAVVTGFTNTALFRGAVLATGANLAPSSYVISVDSATQITLSSPAVATGAGTLTFGLEPITIPEAKQHLRITFTNEDTFIGDLITSARYHLENRLRQSFITQSWTLYLDSFPSAGGYYNRAIRESWPSLGGLPSGLGFYPGMVPNSTGVINIPNPPLISLDSVTYYDFSNTLQTVSTSAYIVSLATPARIQPQYSKVWPIAKPSIDSVQINFTAGYGPTADKVPAAVKSAMKLMIGTWFYNRESVAAGEMRIVPDTVEALIAPIDHGSYA